MGTTRRTGASLSGFPSSRRADSTSWRSGPRCRAAAPARPPCGSTPVDLEVRGGKRQTHTPGEPLRDLLRRQTESLRNEALRNGGDVPAHELDRVARLQRLVEIHAAAHPASSARRWSVAVAFGVTLLLSSVLLFVRVPETDVELDLR